MTLADLIAAANARGFRIRNLFQKSSEGWQANLCDAKTDEGFIFAHGDTPEDALERAIRLSEAERKTLPPSVPPPAPKLQPATVEYDPFS